MCSQTETANYVQSHHRENLQGVVQVFVKALRKVTVKNLINDCLPLRSNPSVSVVQIKYE